MEERVDIVNEQNEVVGEATKKDAHEKGQLHRTVIGLVRRANGSLVLTQQSKDRQDPGQLVSPVGGHVKAGESEESAFFREADEEIGIREFDFKPIGKAIYNREVLGRKENHYFIFYEIYTDEPFVLNYESVDYKEFTEDELTTELQDHPERFGAAFHFVIDTWYPHMKKEAN